MLHGAFRQSPRVPPPHQQWTHFCILAKPWVGLPHLVAGRQGPATLVPRHSGLFLVGSSAVQLQGLPLSDMRRGSLDLHGGCDVYGWRRKGGKRVGEGWESQEDPRLGTGFCRAPMPTYWLRSQSCRQRRRLLG